MNKTDKLLFAATTAALVGVATYSVIKEKSKAFYKEYYKRSKSKVKDDSWLANQAYETWQIKSHDDLTLQGYYVPKQDAKYTIVIIHGYHSRALNMNQYAKAFYENLPCDLFLPDLRAHGNSEGEAVGWGYEDKDDIVSWVSYLNQKLPNRPLIIFGESMGGATVNYLASIEMDNVKVLVEDCGFSDLYEEFDFQAKQLTHLSFAPFYPSFNHEVKKNQGYSIKEASCIESVKNAKYPMMFIHGLDDEVVPVSMAYDLYNACSQDKQLLLVNGAKHTQSILLERERYLTLLSEFIEEHL